MDPSDVHPHPGEEGPRQSDFVRFKVAINTYRRLLKAPAPFDDLSCDKDSCQSSKLSTLDRFEGAMSKNLCFDFSF